MDIDALVIVLLELSQRKKNLLEMLLELTKKQQHLVEADAEDLEEINSLIEEKQKIIFEIDGLDLLFLENYNQLTRTLGFSSLDSVVAEPVEGFKVLKQKIQEVMHLMEEIKKLDDINMNIAKHNLNKIKEQLKIINVGKKATSSYGTKYKENMSILIDKRK